MVFLCDFVCAKPPPVRSSTLRRPVARVATGEVKGETQLVQRPEARSEDVVHDKRLLVRRVGRRLESVDDQLARPRVRVERPLFLHTFDADDGVVGAERIPDLDVFGQDSAPVGKVQVVAGRDLQGKIGLGGRKLKVGRPLGGGIPVAEAEDRFKLRHVAHAADLHHVADGELVHAAVRSALLPLRRPRAARHTSKHRGIPRVTFVVFFLVSIFCFQIHN